MQEAYKRLHDSIFYHYQRFLEYLKVILINISPGFLKENLLWLLACFNHIMPCKIIHTL